jgi:DNA-binding GntR family transcriptional regulator
MIKKENKLLMEGSNILNNLKLKFVLDRKKPLGNQIYSILWEKIITTELYPLTEISEIVLANQINVSRTPVRDALKKLENEGLITTIPQVKSIVSKINLEEVKETLELRATLEVKIVGKLSSSISKKQISILKKINTDIEKNLKIKNFKKIFFLDNLFHKTLAYNVKMPKSWQVIEKISSQISRIRNIAYKYKGNDNFGPKITIKDHKEIINALYKNDKSAAQKAIKKHIMSIERYVLFLKKNEKYKDIIN